MSFAVDGCIRSRLKQNNDFKCWTSASQETDIAWECPTVTLKGQVPAVKNMILGTQWELGVVRLTIAKIGK